MFPGEFAVLHAPVEAEEAGAAYAVHAALERLGAQNQAIGIGDPGDEVRQPIREALHRMEAEGWVDLRPSQGAFVHVPTDTEVDHLLDVRVLLEAETARLAAAIPASAVKAAQLARLREICREGKAAAEADDFAGAVTINNTFHAEIAVIGGNTVLAELAHIVGRRVQWYYRMVAPERGHGSWEEHTELIEAIGAGDPALAREVARQHTERTREAYHRPR